MHSLSAYIGIIRQAAINWWDGNSPRLGAALAFYSALSLGPLLLLALSVLGIIYDRDAAQLHVINQFGNMIGYESAQTIKDFIVSAAAEDSKKSMSATLISIVMLLVGASGVFVQLQDALNTIWNVKPRPGLGVWRYIQQRFLSMGMVIGIAFLLLTSLLVSAGLSAAGEYAFRHTPEISLLLQSINFALSFAVTSLLFAIMLKVLPDARIAWRDVWIGAIVTAFLFTVGKSAIGVYLGHSALTSSYGAAGSFIVILVWVYYSAQIFLFGAELTQTYADTFGASVKS